MITLHWIFTVSLSSSDTIIRLSFKLDHLYSAPIINFQKSLSTEAWVPHQFLFRIVSMIPNKCGSTNILYRYFVLKFTFWHVSFSPFAYVWNTASIHFYGSFFKEQPINFTIRIQLKKVILPNQKLEQAKHQNCSPTQNRSEKWQKKLL